MQGLGINVIFIGNNFERLINGLWITVKISLAAVVLSIIFGLIIGILMNLKNPILNFILKIYVEFIKIMPQLVLLFIVYFGFTTSFGLNLSGETSAIIVFTLWGSAEMGDLMRGALESIPKHQYESAYALGFNKLQTYLYVIISQTVRMLIPVSINLTTRMIKTTTLVTMIGVVEVLKVGQQIIEANRYDFPNSAIWIYALIFIMYFVVCFPISTFGRYLERRWS